ncbi:MAG TPA: hypothetical protein VN913_00045 [Candidatus Binatus sp.]|jgi:hypothetical protein|nr:hypothetical protein [Candidatus Binatus sp.]
MADTLAGLPVPIPPVFVLATLVILLGTQLAYVVAPRAPHYLVRLGLSALAVLLGEALGVAGVGAPLALGELHPVNDLVVLAIVQWAATLWVRRAQLA